MKNMKKVLAFLLATVMMLAMVIPTMAAEDKTITINGLEAGDNVKYYKVVEWAADGSGWVFLEPFKTDLTADQQKEIIGYVDATTTPPTKHEGKITDTTAAIMGSATLGAALNGAGDTVAEGATSWSAGNLAPGLYMALITGAPADKEDGEASSPMHVYNPVFLAVQSDDTGSEVTLPLNYPEEGTAKKTDVSVDKKAKNSAGNWVEATSENVGDVIDFKVETTVPAYLESWTNPEFKVGDSLSSGLTFAVGENDALTTLTVKAGKGENEKTLVEGTDYTVTKKTATEWEISFSKAYLQGRTAAELVTITYQAKITSDAATVNPELNTVKITYSNDPTDSSKHGEKEDKTTHYTFSIDADLFGGENYESSEIIKVGVDAAGNIITTESHTYDNGETHMPLAGAEFKLYKADGTTPYTNENITADTVFVTNEEGKLKVKGGSKTGIHGLEEGTYVLKEVKPPEGYMLMTENVTFVITAEYETVPATETCNAYQQLKGYTVKVNNEVTSTYTMDNGTVTKVKLDDDGHAGDHTFEIKNTQGQGLPSTGGIGTTLFYIIGSILVLGAGILLVVRRRMSIQ